MKKVLLFIFCLFILPLSYGLTYNGTEVDQGIHYWSLDDSNISGSSSFDSWGSNTGTITGPTTGQTGQVNEAYSFDGTNDLVSMSQIANGNTGSMSAWVDWDGTDFRYIYSFGNSGANTNVAGMRITNSKIGWYERTSSVTNTIEGNDTILSNGTWTHLMVTTNGSNWTLYVNGVEQTKNLLSGSETGGWTDDITDDRAGIGLLYRSSAASYFSGDIDEVAIWDYELTQAQVSAVYNHQLGGFRLDEESGDMALTTTVTYPTTNSTIFSYNGSIIITSSIISNCTINDTNWNKDDSAATKHLWTRSSYPSANYSIEYYCNNSNNWNNRTFWFEYSNGNLTIPQGDHYWTFDNAEVSGLTVQDVWGSADGTNNNATTNQTGKINESFLFNGTNAFVDIGTTPALNGNYSINGWFKTSVDRDSFELLFGRADSGATDDVRIRLEATEELRYIHTDAGTGFNDLMSTGTYNDGNWHMVTATFETAVGSKLYIDGSQEGSTATSVTSAISPVKEFWIGAQDRSGSENYFEGNIDDVAVWNYALNSTEVQQIYDHQILGNRLDQAASNETTVSITVTYPSPNSSISTYNGSIILTSNIITNCTINDTNWDKTDTATTTHLFNRTTTPTGYYEIAYFCNNTNVWENKTFYFNYTTPDITSTQKISKSFGNFTEQGGSTTLDKFGIVIEPAGDLDNNGVMDLLVGSDNDNDGATSTGAIYFVFLHPNGTVKEQYKVSDTLGNFDAPLEGADKFGSGLVSLWDLDLDGCNDYLIGAERDGSNEGAMYVIYWNCSANEVRDYVTLFPSDLNAAGANLTTDDFMGSDVEVIGDINKDGILDIVTASDGGNVAKPGFITICTMNRNGSVGTCSDIGNNLGGFGDELEDFDKFGVKVESAGDLDGDGIEDLLVGSVRDDDGVTDGGAMYILFLNESLMVKNYTKISKTSNWADSDLEAYDFFTSSITNMGDLNNDGYTDYLVGAGENIAEVTEKGQAYILYGSANYSVSTAFKIEDGVTNFDGFLDNEDQYGIGSCLIGDINNDTYADIAVGAYLDDDGHTDAGAFYIHFMSEEYPYTRQTPELKISYPINNNDYNVTSNEYNGSVLLHTFTYTKNCSINDTNYSIDRQNNLTYWFENTTTINENKTLKLTCDDYHGRTSTEEVTFNLVGTQEQQQSVCSYSSSTTITENLVCDTLQILNNAIVQILNSIIDMNITYVEDGATLYLQNTTLY